MVILRFFCTTGVTLERQELFPKAYFTHKPIYSYLPLFMSSWNIQEHGDSDLFGFGGGRICGGFPPPLRFGAERPDLPLFLLHPRTVFFDAHLLSPQKIWQLWTLKSYKVLMETPYTIVTPYHTTPKLGMISCKSAIFLLNLEMPGQSIISVPFLVEAFRRKLLLSVRNKYT